MAGTDALVILAQILQLPDAQGSKDNVIAIAQAADPPLDATAFVLGEPTERWIELMGQVMGAWGSVPTAAVRALFLRLSTDPGDVADDGQPDQSADQTPRPGMLSAVGAGWYGTIRGGALYAQTSVNFTNNSGAPINAPAGAITYERNFPAADGANPTYHNTSAVVVNPGLTVSVDIQADQIGTYANAPATTIDHVVTQTYGATNVVTNPSAAQGQDRESRPAYIARCLLAPDSNAPGGPVKAYLRACNTATDGTILTNEATGLPVAILGAQVLPSSATGVVTGYLYGPSGAVSLTDVISANANITGVPIGLLTVTTGVLPDATTIGPNYDAGTGQPNPSGTMGFASSVNLSIAVTYSAKIKGTSVPGGASPGTYTTGGSPPPNVAAVFASIAAAVDAFLPALKPGALDQDTGGNGFVYTPDIGDTIRDAQAGLYNVVLSLPATGSTACAVGHIPVAGAIAGTLVVV